ncbi:error-prone DNA polymerase [Sphingomonas turrisvirgatae]|uniref:Error-prone DNA polymerase n=1 Tax=Sphingomonas turrisvirgatae TaxID=1888892 RepID=A0A1E3LTY3_9SPHN|nr:error-prone DNA polymerase [Sphingomonas turrisvirgatae]ODP37206.1 error-prone DNA polymerase [Sphingomonas turrisvirgatae]
MTDYAELVAATHFSFLRGASHPDDIIARAHDLDLAGIGIADRNTVAGVVRAQVTMRRLREKAAAAGLPEPRIKYVPGARLVFVDGTPDIVAYPVNRRGWGNLCKLLTQGNLRAEKGDCILRLTDLVAYQDDLLLIVLPTSTASPQRPRRKLVAFEPDIAEPQLTLVQPPGLEPLLQRLVRLAPGRVWLGATMARQGQDERRLAELALTARRAGIPLIAVGDTLYADPMSRPLQDVLTCIREGTTVHDAGRRLEANAERHLKPSDEMARLFAGYPDAIAQTRHLLDRIEFDLDQLRYEYPHEPVPAGWEPQAWLEHITIQAAHDYYPPDKLDEALRLLADEFELIARRNYAYYFLTVHDLVKFARNCDPPILCQGRGSAANSIVCFLLGVTSVDPVRYKLLFSRFVSDERDEPPDIDVDFEHERREEVMQYIYERYGRHRAGIASTVIHYRPRSAVREVGKALGLTEDITGRIVDTVWGSFSSELPEHRVTEAGFDVNSPEIRRLIDLVAQLLGQKAPRHLSQHVGGFVLTQDRLDETVPLHNGAMEDRTFIEWDKDDIDALELMKVDVLALGMLTCVRKAFDLMKLHDLGEQDLRVDLDSDDPEVYAMLEKGDSVGVFQVESRAQMNMLPRLAPKSLYDLSVQVAIVRPGPIEGDMVHPYLRRRCGEENMELPSPGPDHPQDELEQLLGQTYGVPIFQEQAMKLAITAAGFTPSEANQLRRAMATFRHVGTIGEFETKMVEGMAARGYERDFAQRCYNQIKGFGSYGFPESHALSFARLVYVSAWLKCHHPAVFCCALLNSQPMGFYAPAQLVRDAREHDVEIRPIDVNYSGWDNSLEPDGRGGLALRIGFRQIDGFRQDWGNDIAAEHANGRYDGVEPLARRADLPRRALRLLADADAYRSLGLSRREGLWEARRTPSGALPLFAAARARELGEEPEIALPAMPLSEEVAADYQVTRLSLKDHPMTFLRDTLQSEGVLSCAETSAAKAGRRVRTAGVVLIRQRPGKGNAIFITLEDETGVTNVLLWARDFERQRRAVMASRLMVVEGVIQRSKEGVVHLMASTVTDRTALLSLLNEETPHLPLCPTDEVARGPSHRHPRDVRILPGSRDFH